MNSSSDIEIIRTSFITKEYWVSSSNLKLKMDKQGNLFRI